MSIKNIAIRTPAATGSSPSATGQADPAWKVRRIFPRAVATLLALVFSSLAQAEIASGIYRVTGIDSRWGTYSGQVEIRASDEAGIHDIIHIQQWDDARFEGDSIALAWEGVLDLSGSEPTVEVSLERVGFVTEYGDLMRNPDPTANAPVLYSSELVKVDEATFEVSFRPAPGDQEWTFDETWIWDGLSGPTPIWVNERVSLQGHDPVPEQLKERLFRLFKSYHEMPEVQPYVERPEFQEAMHYWIFDPTDYDFYRSQPDVLRVVQKIVDPISLVETRLRARAYRHSLAEKQAVFDEQVPVYFLNDPGMITGFDPTLPEDIRQTSDRDSMLWTGSYVASQAMRYLVTGETEALETMTHALEGQILCYEIVPTPGEFARTLRTHIEGADDEWIQGEGEYSEIDWLPGGNNDMLKGFYSGFLWAHLALEKAGGYGDLQARMVDVLQGLLDYNPLLQVQALSDVTDIYDRMVFLLLSHTLEPDLSKYLEYAAYYKVVAPWLTATGNGSVYWYGIADWSGIHLGIQTLLALVMGAETASDPLLILEYHALTYRDAMATALDRLRHTRIGLAQLVYGTLGSFSEPPPELEDALWVLREMPAPKERYEIDYSINPAFCLSPFPEEPWKLDWLQTDRFQSLSVYPLFEKGPRNYRWKVPPGSFDGTATGDWEPGVDYLFAYWLGRYFGVIRPDM
jgi:hypothetical protein